MAITVVCNCGNEFSVRDDLAGRKVRCPDCQNPVAVPDDYDDDAPRVKKRPIKKQGSNLLLFGLLGGGVALFGCCCLGLGAGAIFYFSTPEKARTVPLEEKGRWATSDSKRNITVVALKGEVRKSYYKTYRVDLKANKTYIIELTSKSNLATQEPDPYLIVEDKNGRTVAEDDDGGEFLNARLTFKPPSDGVYTIVAASIRGIGDFTLTVKELTDTKIAGKGPDNKGPENKGPENKGPDVKGPDNFPADKGLAVLLAETNRWTLADPLMDITPAFNNMKVKSRYKTYRVELKSTKTYVIDLMSNSNQNGQPDPYLILEDKTGKKVGEDDDSGGALNARIKFRPPSDGTYKVTAASINGIGEYTLTVKEAQEVKSSGKLPNMNGPEKVLVGRWKVDIEETRKITPEKDKKTLDAMVGLISNVSLEFRADGSMTVIADQMITGTWRVVEARNNKLTIEVAQPSMPQPTLIDITVTNNDRLRMAQKSNKFNEPDTVWKRF